LRVKGRGAGAADGATATDNRPRGLTTDADMISARRSAAYGNLDALLGTCTPWAGTLTLD
jgi:hypothetical protein